MLRMSQVRPAGLKFKVKSQRGKLPQTIGRRGDKALAGLAATARSSSVLGPPCQFEVAVALPPARMLTPRACSRDWFTMGSDTPDVILLGVSGWSSESIPLTGGCCGMQVCECQPLVLLQCGVLATFPCAA